MEMREQQERECSNRAVIYETVTESAVLVDSPLLVMLGTIRKHSKTLEAKLRYIMRDGRKKSPGTYLHNSPQAQFVNWDRRHK